MTIPELVSMHNDQNSYIANTDSDTEQKKVQTDKWTDRKKIKNLRRSNQLLCNQMKVAHTHTHTPIYKPVVLLLAYLDNKQQSHHY